MKRAGWKPSRPTEDRSDITGVYDCRWGLNVVLSGYKGPSYSDRRHHWIPLTWAIVPPGGMCVHCGDFLPRSGPPSWRCRGPGFP